MSTTKYYNSTQNTNNTSIVLIPYGINTLNSVGIFLETLKVAFCVILYSTQNQTLLLKINLRVYSLPNMDEYMYCKEPMNFSQVHVIAMFK